MGQSAQTFVMKFNFQTCCVLQFLFGDQRCAVPELDRTHEFRKENCSLRRLVMHLCFGRTNKHVQSLNVTFHSHNLFSIACSFSACLFDFIGTSHTGARVFHVMRCEFRWSYARRKRERVSMKCTSRALFSFLR